MSEHSGAESRKGLSFERKPRFSPNNSRDANPVEFENCRIQTLCALPEPNGDD